MKFLTHARERVPRVGVALLMVFSAVSRLSAADWPWWRGPTGDGVSAETVAPAAMDGKLEILWKAEVGSGYSSPAIAGGRLYTMGNARNTDTVYSIDVSDGRVVWTFTYPCGAGSYSGPKATPAVDGDRVYTLSREGHLHCLDAATGTLRWSAHLVRDFQASAPQWDFAGSPVVHGGLIIVNAGRAGLALDKMTGRKVWGGERGRSGYAAPVLYRHAGRTAVAMFGESTVFGVDALDGSTLWTYAWRTGSNVNAADPIVHDGKVFVASAYGKGSAAIDISGRSPTLVWQNSLFQTHFSSFVLLDGHIYGNDGDARQPTGGTFRCVEFATGREKWSVRLGFGSLIAVRNGILMLTAAGTLHLGEASPDGYRQLAEASLPRSQYWTPPAVADGRIYCRDVRGNLYCINAR